VNVTLGSSILFQWSAKRESADRSLSCFPVTTAGFMLFLSLFSSSGSPTGEATSFFWDAAAIRPPSPQWSPSAEGHSPVRRRPNGFHPFEPSHNRCSLYPRSVLLCHRAAPQPREGELIFSRFPVSPVSHFGFKASGLPKMTWFMTLWRRNVVSLSGHGLRRVLIGNYSCLEPKEPSVFDKFLAASSLSDAVFRPIPFKSKLPFSPVG